MRHDVCNFAARSLRHRVIATLFLLLLAAFAGMARVEASAALRLELDDLTLKAAHVAHGSVTAVNCAWDKKKIWTTYTLSVTETLKGEAGQSLTFRVRGGRVGNVCQAVSGAPTLEAGKEYLLFLWRDNERKLQPLAFNQGVFAVTRPEAGDATAENSFAGLTVVKRSGEAAEPEKSLPIRDTLANLKTRVRAALAKIEDIQKPAERPPGASSPTRDESAASGEAAPPREGVASSNASRPENGNPAMPVAPPSGNAKEGE